MVDVDVVGVLGRTDLFAAVGREELRLSGRLPRHRGRHGGSRPARSAHRELGVGDYFGEIALIDGQPRSATVVATRPLTTVSLASWEFRPILREEPTLAFELLKVLCSRRRAAEAR